MIDLNDEIIFKYNIDINNFKFIKEWWEEWTKDHIIFRLIITILIIKRSKLRNKLLTQSI